MPLCHTFRAVLSLDTSATALLLLCCAHTETARHDGYSTDSSTPPPYYTCPEQPVMYGTDADGVPLLPTGPCDQAGTCLVRTRQACGDGSTACYGRQQRRMRPRHWAERMLRRQHATLLVDELDDHGDLLRSERRFVDADADSSRSGMGRHGVGS